MERYYIVNDGGEVIQDLGENIDNATFTRLDPNDVVIKRGAGIGLEETKEVDFNYAKINYKAGMELYKKCPQVLMILPYINFMDNILKYSNGKLVTASNFAKHTGYNKNYITEVFKKLRDNEIISIVSIRGKVAYKVNPYVVMKGKKMTVSTIELFKNTDWEIYGRKGNKYVHNGKETD